MLIILDVNFDDVITVLNLVANGVRIYAVVITGLWGNPGIGAANLLDLLSYLKSEKIPVFVGSLTTINAESVYPESLYFIDTLWNTMHYIPRKKHALPVPGRDYVTYVKCLCEDSRKIDVLCMASFTDLVPLLDLDVIDRIYALAANVSGEVTDPISDTKHSNVQSNIYADPIAAFITLSKAHEKIYWLDVLISQAIPVNKTTVLNVKRVLKDKYGSEYNNTVKGRACFFIYKLLKNMVTVDYSENIYIWDYVLALTVLCPQLFDARKIRIDINAEQTSNIVRTETQTIVTRTFSKMIGQFTVLPPDADSGYLTNYIYSADESVIRDKFIESL